MLLFIAIVAIGLLDALVAPDNFVFPNPDDDDVTLPGIANPDDEVGAVLALLKNPPELPEFVIFDSAFSTVGALPNKDLDLADSSGFTLFEVPIEIDGEIWINILNQWVSKFNRCPWKWSFGERSMIGYFQPEFYKSKSQLKKEGVDITKWTKESVF